MKLLSDMLNLTPSLARRLAIAKQRLAGPLPPADPSNMLGVVRNIGCLQLDPISVVARSHQLVLFSRVGKYDLAHLDQLLWHERSLFEYWAHCASIVPTEDYPLHNVRMRRYLDPNAPTASAWAQRMRQWVKDNQKLKRHILAQFKKHGPLLSRELEEDGIYPKDWVSTGWTSGRNLSRMLDYLWMAGQIMVAGRQGIQKIWDLAERCLPKWTPRESLTEREMTRRAVQRSLRALGVGTARHINYHFLRGRYHDLPKALASLEGEGKIKRVEIRDGSQAWPGVWYIHADDEHLITDHRERLRQSLWDGSSRTAPPVPTGRVIANGSASPRGTLDAPRTTLLSPFDNLICDRARTQQLFNFDFRIEIYTPKAKRKYGYYVLPILHGDQLIGRIDPEMDREHGRLTVNAAYAEPGAPRDAGPAVAGAIQDLAAFLGAGDIVYNRRRAPAIWKRALSF